MVHINRRRQTDNVDTGYSCINATYVGSKQQKLLSDQYELGKYETLFNQLVICHTQHIFRYPLQTRNIFKSILQPTSCLHYLEPYSRCQIIISPDGLLKIPQNPALNKEIPVNHVLCIIPLSVVSVSFRHVIYVYT